MYGSVTILLTYCAEKDVKAANAEAMSNDRKSCGRDCLFAMTLFKKMTVFFSLIWTPAHRARKCNEKKIKKKKYPRNMFLRTPYRRVQDAQAARSSHSYIDTK